MKKSWTMVTVQELQGKHLGDDDDHDDDQAPAEAEAEAEH